MKLIKKLKSYFAKLGGIEIHTEEVASAVSSVSKTLIINFIKTPQAVLDEFETTTSGLTELESQSRLEKFGKNQLSHEKAPKWYRQLGMAFFDPFIGVFFILGLASFFVEFVFAHQNEKDLTSMIVISVLILISGFLTFFQELRANQNAERLLSLVQNTTIVEPY